MKQDETRFYCTKDIMTVILHLFFEVNKPALQSTFVEDDAGAFNNN